MGDIPGHLRTCLHMGKLAHLAILVSGGVVLQILACALYDNRWPMLTVAKGMGSDNVRARAPSYVVSLLHRSLFSESDSLWVNANKFLTGFSAVGNIAIPTIWKHADVIGWGALALELSSFFVFAISILCFLGVCNDDDDDYSIL